MRTEGFDMDALASIAKEVGSSVSLPDGDVPVVTGTLRPEREVTKTLGRGYDLWENATSPPDFKDSNVSRESAINFLTN